MADDYEYKFGEVPRDGSVNDPGLVEYNIFALAEQEAERYQNRQAEQRAERDRLLAAREQLVSEHEGASVEADDAE